MSLFDGPLGHLADALKSMLPQGAQSLINAAPNVINAVHSAVAAFDHLKEANGGHAPPQAQAIRDQRLAEVTAHAGRVADSLDGGAPG
jgi:hypothetical protein